VTGLSDVESCDATDYARARGRHDRNESSSYVNPYPSGTPQASAYYSGWCERNLELHLSQPGGIYAAPWSGC